MTLAMQGYAQCSVTHTAIVQNSSLPREITLSSMNGVGERATGVKIRQVGYI